MATSAILDTLPALHLPFQRLQMCCRVICQPQAGVLEL